MASVWLHVTISNTFVLVKERGMVVLLKQAVGNNLSASQLLSDQRGNLASHCHTVGNNVAVFADQ